MFSKILIANRGEIAVRIIRTAREMNVATVAVYSESDRDALHVRMADEAYLIGPASPSLSYLNVDKLIEVAQRSGAEAVHPGYGFLAENAALRAASLRPASRGSGRTPTPSTQWATSRARAAMQKAKVPVVPGGIAPIEDLEGASRRQKLRLPVGAQASGGGGGKGLKIAHDDSELQSAFETARREAEAYFKNPTIYAELSRKPCISNCEILADKRHRAPRRRTRLLAAAAAPSETLGRSARAPHRRPAPQDARRCRAGRRAIGYDSVGTIECLVSGSRFFFLEMNTRIQVEHTVTEMVTGMDLIREQIRVAAGEPLGFLQDDIRFDGFAIECRVNAEDPSQDFRPAPGTIGSYREPGGPGVRVDSAAFPGMTISADYDSMIAKLIVWAPTRLQTIARFKRAIDEFAIGGVPTTLPLLRALCDDPDVVEGDYGTATLETFAAPQTELASNVTPDLPPKLRRATSFASRSTTDVSRSLDRSASGTSQTVRTAAASRRAPNGRMQRQRLTRAPADARRRDRGEGRDRRRRQRGTRLARRAMKMMNDSRASRGTVGNPRYAGGRRG